MPKALSKTRQIEMTTEAIDEAVESKEYLGMILENFGSMKNLTIKQIRAIEMLADLANDLNEQGEDDPSEEIRGPLGRRLAYIEETS